MTKRLLLLLSILVIIVAAPLCYGKEGEMTLLAMSQKEGDIRGHVADLHLEITPGSGRIYMDTYPLTELDTQISIRFAREIACDYLTDIDCSNYNFYYTIRSDSIMVGGPSAGAALTVLTLATLEDWDINEKHTVTGTINPGGFIGTVGGVGAKLEAASREQIEKVLIPTGSMEAERLIINETPSLANETIDDPEEVAKDKGIELIEVSTLDDVLYELQGIEPEYKEIDIIANERYKSVMQDISSGLCERTDEFFESIEEMNDSLYITAKNLSQQSEEAIANNAYYSASSFCFGANVNLNQLELMEKNLTEEQINNKTKSIKTKISELNEKLEEEMKGTINDLQTYMVVKERLKESEEFLERVNKSLEINDTKTAIYNLAYGEERLKSADSWAKFLGHEGKKFDMDDEALENSCIRKLSEAEERLQYARLHVGGAVQEIRNILDTAYDDRGDEEYALCLFRASKAKAEADLLLGSLGVTQKNIDDYIDIKLRAIEQIIEKQQEAGIFPILGYSYYEYAKSLRDTDPHSAMLYSEYALELSKIELYFTPPEKERNIEQVPEIFHDKGEGYIFYFLLGILIGILLMIIFYPLITRRDEEDIRIKLRGKD